MSLIERGARLMRERQTRYASARRSLAGIRESSLVCELCRERWRAAHSTMCEVCDTWVERVEDELAAQAVAIPRRHETHAPAPAAPRAIPVAWSGGRRRCVRCGRAGDSFTSRGYCARCDARWRDDRAASIRWARAGIRRWRDHRDWVILDTETTGLDATARIVEIAVLAPNGVVLFDSLVRPTRPIPVEASSIHHVTDTMVARAPAFPALYPALERLLRGRTIAVYNAAYDRRVLDYETRRAGLPPPAPEAWTCAMEHYARFAGEWNPRYAGYRWPKLTGGDHSALGDCRATRALVERMAASSETEICLP
jgi:DNA polymerase-3 subunit epsilon